MNRMIEIKTPEQAEKINLLASKAPYEVWLSTDTVMLDARSLLGLLSLVGQRVRVVAEDNVSPYRSGERRKPLSALFFSGPEKARAAGFYLVLSGLVCYDILVKVSAFGGTGFGTKERTDPPGGLGPPAGI